MSDRRLTPANGRVAAARLRGRVEAAAFVQGSWQRVIAPLTDLMAAPGGPRDRQLRMGERFEVLERRAGHAFGQAARDGYVGYVALDALGPDAAATHIVVAPGTHLYAAADIRARELATLSLGALLTVVATPGHFVETDAGHFVPAAHVAALTARPRDPVAVAERLIGTPYLWGGNSRTGLDCSALVQMACQSCAIPCPGDSDLQEAALGAPIADGAGLRRGDLVFWRGHVGWMTDAVRLLHANAHHMAVTHEPLAEATARIARAGGGPVTSRRRLPAAAGTP